MDICNSVSIRSIIIGDAEALLEEEATDNAKTMNQWLEEQASIVHTIGTTLASGNITNTDDAMDYLEKNLSENDSALMYYLCFGYDGGVFPADHSTLDLDPTTRSWWTDSVAADDLIYTAPYTDFSTGKMIVSIAEPLMFHGEQAVILADITIDELITVTQQISTDDSIQTFLLASDNSVISHQNEEFLPKEEGNTVLTDIVSIDLDATEAAKIKDYDGASRYAAIGKIESTGWKLGVTQDVSVITGKIAKNLAAPLIVGVVVLILMILILNTLIGSLLKPLSVMKMFVKEKVIGLENCKQHQKEVSEIAYLIDELEKRFIATIRQTKEESGIIQDKMTDANHKV
jgi:hypothetical protein